MTENLN